MIEDCGGRAKVWNARHSASTRWTRELVEDSVERCAHKVYIQTFDQDSEGGHAVQDSVAERRVEPSPVAVAVDFRGSHVRAVELEILQRHFLIILKLSHVYFSF